MQSSGGLPVLDVVLAQCIAKPEWIELDFCVMVTREGSYFVLDVGLDLAME